MYNQKIMNRFNNPYNAGALRGANANGKAGAVENGEFVKIYLSVDENNCVSSAKFKAFGSAVTIAVCDYVCDLICKKDLDEVLSISSNDIINALDIPDSKLSTVSLTIEAVRNAIETYLKKLEKTLKNS